MSYEKDQTYLGLASQALDTYDSVLREVPELKGLPMIEPTPWGDPQFVLKIDPMLPGPRVAELMVKIRDLVVGVPVVFKFVREE